MRGGVDVSWGGPFFQWQKLAKIGNKWQHHVELFVKTTCCLIRNQLIGNVCPKKHH